MQISRRRLRQKRSMRQGIPAQPDAAIPARLKLTTYAVTERYGLVWVRLVDNGSVHFLHTFRNGTIQTIFRLCQPAWLLAELQPDRQVEGFLDVSHFAFVHTESFGERENPEVPDYPVERLPHGFRAAGCQHCEQLSAQSKASRPPGFKWR